SDAESAARKMCFTRHYLIFYILIAAFAVDFSWSSPVMMQSTDSAVLLNEARFRRQVVQPTWFNFDPKSSIDPTVHVNKKALEMADMIRKTIQKAVDEDTYVVTGEEPTTNIFKQQSSNADQSASNWYLKLQKLWQNWSQAIFKGLKRLHNWSNVNNCC
ncbi:hypothetical protein DOY81_007014, partial [Sarcophaga bullata]